MPGRNDMITSLKDNILPQADVGIVGGRCHQPHNPVLWGYTVRLEHSGHRPAWI